jgi:2-C-methyl-D-erythritol 4-phosphate cytidylyltransferase
MTVLALVVATARAHSVDSVDDARPAALTTLCGVPLIAHAVRGLLESNVVDQVLALVRPSEIDDIAAALRPAGPPSKITVMGHHPNQEPIRESLLEVSLPEVLLVHEVTRARAPAELVRRVVEAVRAGADAVTPVLPCSDTVKRVDPAGLVVGTPDRSGLRVVQTPRAWSARLADQVLRQVIESAVPAVPVTETMRAVEGHPDAQRLNSAFALAVAELAGAGE